ncbi:hypothetical protein [Laspinema palackyanum]|uniref:hypothetical protein n=1 Tax=Laspinema palackyanum TaxID=3231601 RepID=UPI00345D87E5|nr:hypothetical protein [Laspinema sp. D2c]
MAINLDLFSGTNFRSTIQNYCTQLKWRINDINDRRAILRFNASSGNTQTLFIIRYENTLEFSVPSGLKFNSDSEIPGVFSTYLLVKNASYKLGFWCIEEISGQKVFSIMHNAEISLINANYFERVVLRLVNECDEFEQAITHILNY